MSQTAQPAFLNDVAKRFKNISARETPINHISNKVYEAAQNSSFYTNAYQYIQAQKGDQS